jgi:hypothetical protein
MTRNNVLASAVFAVAAFWVTATAQDLLTGDTRLACEAVLCLATSTRPSECSPSLQRYFGISYRNISDTIKARGNFLKLCPASSQTPEMSALVNAMADGAGRCDVQSLNTALLSWDGSADAGRTYISNQMPQYCTAYTSHAYTNFSGTLPRYVGTPERGGYWVEAGDYQRALAD